MNNFTIIYRILRILEKTMDCDELDTDMISPDVLGISQNRWNAIMEMLSDEGYVKGLSIRQTIAGTHICTGGETRITLKGLEYLEDNSIMKKAAGIARGIKEIVPGI